MLFKPNNVFINTICACSSITLHNMMNLINNKLICPF